MINKNTITLAISTMLVMGHLFIVPISLAGFAYNVEKQWALIPYVLYIAFANTIYLSKRNSTNEVDRLTSYLFFKTQAVLILFFMVIGVMIIGSVL